MVPASLKIGRKNRASQKRKRSRASDECWSFATDQTVARVQPLVMMAQNQSSMLEQYVTVREDMFFIVTEHTASGEQQSWQVHMVQVSLQPQSKIVQKPRKI